MKDQNKYNKNWNDFGENLKDSIGDAISHGDFGSINDFIKGTVRDAIDGVEDAIDGVGDAVNGFGDAVNDAINGAFDTGRHHNGRHYGGKHHNAGYNDGGHYNSGSYNGRHYNGRHYNGRSYNGRPRSGNPGAQAASDINITGNGIYYPKVREENKCVKKIGVTGAILCNIFGGIGLGTTTLIGLSALSSAAVMGTFAAGMMILPAFFACLFGSLIHRGSHILNRTNRAVRYAALADDDEYVTLDSLSLATGKSKKYITKDIQKMLELGIYPEGHLDKQKTCLILTDKMYQTYLDSEESRRASEAEKNKKTDKSSKAGTDTGKSGKSDSENSANSAGSDNLTDSENKEFDEMMAEGNECIKKLRDLNDLIEGEVISEKLYRLENLLREIFAYVKVHPEKMGKIHKLMNYYLPTTLKLVEAYSEFDDIKEPGADVENAKKQIEGTLDTINEAFTELQNSLMRDKVYDVTTDAEVLKTMLSKEGLINRDFEKNNSGGQKI